MPDRDSVPKGVAGKYKNICQQISEFQSPAYVARTI